MDLEGWQTGGDDADPTSYAKTGIWTTGHQPTHNPIPCGHTFADQASGADCYSYPIFVETL